MKGSVEFEDLCYTHPSGRGIHHLSLSVSPSEIVCIFGRNGSGKSTLFTLLSTYLPLQGGSYQVCGLDATRDRKKVRRCIYPVFDDNAHFERATGRENLELFLTLTGSREYGGALPGGGSDLGLGPDLNRPVEEYSLGMKRKLYLIQALQSSKPVLYFDEPALGLDSASKESFFHQLRHRASQGAAVIYGTNRVEETRYADRICMLQNGELRPVSTPNEVVRELIPIRIGMVEGERMEYLDRIEDLPALVRTMLSLGDLRAIEVLGTNKLEGNWTVEAEQKVARVPDPIRPMVRKLVERHAREQGYVRITEQVVEEAKKRFEGR